MFPDTAVSLEHVKNASTRTQYLKAPNTVDIIGHGKDRVPT